MARRKRKVKLGRILILAILIAILIYLAILAFDKFNTKSPSVSKVKEISNIKEYDYSLKENATPYFKKLFKELEKTLEEEEVDEEKYLTLVSQLFVSDFFNLDNKVSKNDVGGKQFVYKDYQVDFEKYAMDTMYKTVESNVYGDRKQELPIVNKVDISNVSKQAFSYGDSKDDEAYVVDFDITYDDDLGYQSSGSLIVIHSGKKLEIAALKEKSSSNG